MLRRSFLRAGSLTGGALLLNGVGDRTAGATQAAPVLPSVTDPLYTSPIADAGAVPRFVNALPRPPRIDAREGGTRNLYLGETVQDILGGGLGLPSRVWGVGHRTDQGEVLPVSSPGPTILAHAHRAVRVGWANELPYRHLLPVDETIHWAYTGSPYTLAEHGVPVVMHLHGARALPHNDGHPDAWYSPAGITGGRYTGTRFGYQNGQEAATLWYHDHAHGITRLSVYAGLAGFYLLRDDTELRLTEQARLPAEPYDIELLLQDRAFHPDGRLAYPDAPAHSAERASHMEFFGQVVTVNGKAWPYLDVEPRSYRFRLLNGSNSRFYRLSCGGRWPFPASVIGGDGGFLERPLPLHEGLLIAPGERVDLVLDFRSVAGGAFELTNDAPTPFPSGAPVRSPADRVLQFRVNRPFDRTFPEPVLPRTLRDAPYTLSTTETRTRKLLLSEHRDGHGRVRHLLGTVEQGRLGWHDPVTETPGLDDTEVWEFYNTTHNTHAVHLHLVQFQVLDEAPFTAEEDPETGALSDIRLGRFQPPHPTEQGPKDTVRVPPRTVTRIKARFDIAGDFVWHCHLLEHEDHEMMRGLRIG